MKKSRMGVVVLSIWLIIQGLVPLLDFHISYLNVILAILAISAGILLLVEK